MKSERRRALVEFEPENDQGNGGEQNGSATDSQAHGRQARPARRLVKPQTAVFADWSGKAADGPATRTLSHTNPPSKGGRWLPASA